MIMRLSAKLGRKIGVTPTETLPLHENPVADWSSHLFTVARAQHILITNTATLYSMLMPGRGVSNDREFLRDAIDLLGGTLRDDGLEPAYQRYLAPFAGEAGFAKALNRSVTGSMNDLIQQAKFFLDTRDVTLREVAFHLNDVPLSYLKYSTPREMFRALCRQLGVDEHPPVYEGTSNDGRLTSSKSGVDLAPAD